MVDLFDEFGNVLSPAAEIGVGDAPLVLPNAPAGQPAPAARPHAANALQPARVRAPSKCITRVRKPKMQQHEAKYSFKG